MTKTWSNKTLFFLGIGLIVLFGLIRSIIIYFFPIENFSEYVVQDTIKNIPRLAIGALSLWFSLKFYTKSKLGLAWKFTLAPFIFLVLDLLITFGLTFSSEPYQYSPYEFWILAFSAMIVGGFEEILFRGLVFQSAKEWRGTWFAIWASSFLFMVFHIQAQPVITFPFLFMSGITYGILRASGSSLIQLMLIHGVYDAVLPLFGRERESSERYILFKWCIYIIVPVVIYLMTRKRLNTVHEEA